MAFSDFLASTGVDLSSDTGVFNFSFITDLVIFLVLAVFAGAFTYWYLQRKTYNKTIVKFREVNGITRRIGVEKAKEITLPNTSVRAYYLRKSQFYIPRPSIESAENEYWMFVRNDGEWVNVGLTNLNEELLKFGLKYDHTDMRMANAALKKLVDRSYKKSNWIKEWAPYIGFSVVIILVAISGYLVIGEAAKVNSATATNVVTLGEILKSMNEILSNVNNIGSSSGVKPAG